MFYVLLYANIKFPTPWVEKVWNESFQLAYYDDAILKLILLLYVFDAVHFVFILLFVVTVQLLYLQLCFYVCLPACVLKQLVNIVQLASAADAIASKDANDYNKEHVN